MLPIKLSKSQKNYSTTRKELLACVVFTQHFRHYLIGKRFEFRTDHASLPWLLTFKNPTGILARWFEILSAFDFDIVYRPGAENIPADVMSRCPQSRDAETQTDDYVRAVSANSWSNSFLRHEQEQDLAISEMRDIYHWVSDPGLLPFFLRLFPCCANGTDCAWLMVLFFAVSGPVRVEMTSYNWLSHNS